MDSNYYQIYTDACLALARSLVIKSSATADAINDGLTTNYGSSIVDLSDPTSWKYYLNVSGQYHATDTIMQVVSLDTLQTIQFTSDNLAHHQATAEAYAYGSTMYLELVNKYPTQEQLILGILYPCDINTAIAADDGTILSYPPFLVEEYEYTLIAQLQTWIQGFLARWNNIQYAISDDLYNAGLIAVLTLNLLPAIMIIRKKACKTNEVHSYHLQMYLASFGYLDSYMRYMTRDQILFLYRNIAYIRLNAGKQSVFNWLVEHIMTSANLPLARYEMRHDVSGMPTSLKPTVGFQKIPVNNVVNADTKSVYTLTEVFEKELPLAKDNARYQDDEMLESERKMEYSLDNRLRTKLLESSLIDYDGSEHYTLANTLLYEWMDLSAKGLYTAYVNFESPAGGEHLSLTAFDALTFYAYAQCAAIGIPLANVPLIVAPRVIRHPLPLVTELMSVVDTSRVPATFATQMLELIPPLFNPLISVSAFYNYAVTLQRAAMQQYFQVCQEGLDQTKAQKMNLVSRMWSDQTIQLGDHAGQSYASWFNSRNIDIDSYTTDMLGLVPGLILPQVTGVDAADVVTLADIQRQMVALMATLSSYSVQFTTEINSLPILDAPTSVLRPDNIHGSMLGDLEAPMTIGELSLTGKLNQMFDYDIGAATAQTVLYADWGNTHSAQIDFQLETTGNVVTWVGDVEFNVRFTYDLPALASNPNRLEQVLGLDMYLALTPEQQATIPSLWASV